jgi:hypothetical protein
VSTPCGRVVPVGPGVKSAFCGTKVQRWHRISNRSAVVTAQAVDRAGLPGGESEGQTRGSRARTASVQRMAVPGKPVSTGSVFAGVLFGEQLSAVAI